MARIVKLILFLLLAVVLHVASGSAVSEIPTDKASLTHVPSSSVSHAFDKVHLPFAAEAELGSIGIQLSQSSFSRDDRTAANGWFLAKSIIRLLKERESLMFSCNNKVEDSALLTPIIHPVSEYYVFGLRRILI